MNYPDNLIVVPLENKVLLPSVVLRLIIHGKDATELTRSYFRQVANKTTSQPQQEIYIGCVPLQPQTFEKKQDTDATNGDISSQAPQMPNVFSSNKDKENKHGGLVAIKDRPRLLEYGCLARIVRVQRSGVNLFGVFVEGVARFKVNAYSVRNDDASKPFHGCLFANVKYYSEMATSIDCDNEVLQFKQLCRHFVTRMRELQLPETLLQQLTKIVETSAVTQLADLLVSLIETTFEERLLMLKTDTLKARLEKASSWITRQIQVLQISDSFGPSVDGKLSRKQREFYLRQQLDAIQDEINKTDNKAVASSEPPEEDELGDLHRRLAHANLPNDVVAVAQREIKRIKKLQPSSSEWAVSRNYLEWLADIPWSASSATHLDISRSKKQLDNDHFGLEHVKKRIIEYLSVVKIKGDLKAPIICLAGPPGVGKTSLGRSIAQSLSREFHRISLGGIRDEADIRGHRRTYVGAMPGLIMQGLRKCGVNNPVVLLDEIDKLVHSTNYGDPAAALLEVLDPEQNHAFSDHYINVPFDLSNVLFIATANSLDTIPEPLLDRMEVIELHGYTFDEKLRISKTHLVPKQTRAHGLELGQLNITDPALLYICENYTRESGVRSLERTLASVVRSKCVELASLYEERRQHDYNPFVDVEDVKTILGNPKYEREVSERDAYPGVVTGLAYSGSGNGGILFVEATKMPGDGKICLTGSLGNVIQESAQIALSWVKAHAYSLRLTASKKEKLAQEDDIHIHFPSGSIPKDGPSAGVTLVCALVSLYSGQRVPTTTAMTGEISLRGQVLPVGGIKEKIISAHRAGIRKIILPYRNEKDVQTDVPETVSADIEFCYARTISDVLDAALENRWSHRLVESHL